MTLKVNDEVIPEEAVMHELSRLVHFYSQHMSQEEIRAQMPILKAKAKEQAIGAKLLLNEADRLDIRVEDEELTARLEKIIEESGGKEKFGEMLVTQNITMESLKNSIDQGCRVEKLVAQMTSDAPMPTEADIKAHFETHTDEYRKPERALARHILVPVEGDNEEEKIAAKQKVEEIRQRIVDGADFAAEAAEHSSCPSGQSNGGSLGWFGRGAMVPEFDNAVFSMEVGELSAIIETSFGFHIIEKTEHDDGADADFDDVREHIRDFLIHSKRGEVIASNVAELREKATIVDDEEESSK
jgi:parvulin-like peptidyl-prolyl isomerase